MAFYCDSDFPDRSIGLSNVQTGRLDKARLTGKLHLAVLTLKSGLIADQKVGWSTALLGYFFWLLGRSDWRVRDDMSYPQWIAVRVAHALSRSDKKSQLNRWLLSTKA